MKLRLLQDQRIMRDRKVKTVLRRVEKDSRQATLAIVTTLVNRKQFPQQRYQVSQSNQGV